MHFCGMSPSSLGVSRTDFQGHLLASSSTANGSNERKISDMDHWPTEDKASVQTRNSGQQTPGDGVHITEQRNPQLRRFQTQAYKLA
jgi:hypothetical protein